MFERRGKLIALAAGITTGEYFKEIENQSVISSTELQEILEEIHVYLMSARKELDYIPIDTEQLKLDKNAKVNLIQKARIKARLPSRPIINKMWIVKPTIRARLPIH